MKRPSFQFYPDDWTGNAKLRRCKAAHKGAWIDVLCLLHDSEEYGVLRCPLSEIAQAVGHRLALLRELRERGILKGADTGEKAEAFIYTPRHAGKDGKPVTLIPAQPGPIWYSSRMVRDEYVRSKRGFGAGFGAPFGGEPIPPIGDRAPSPSPSPSPSSKQQHRAVAVSVLIRKLEHDRGKAPRITSTDPRVQAWAEKGVTDQQLAEAHALAVADRVAKGEDSPINAGFLDVFVMKVLHPGNGKSALSHQAPERDTTCGEILEGGKRCGAPGVFGNALGTSWRCREHEA